MWACNNDEYSSKQMQVMEWSQKLLKYETCVKFTRYYSVNFCNKDFSAEVNSFYDLPWNKAHQLIYTKKKLCV